MTVTHELAEHDGDENWQGGTALINTYRMVLNIDAISSAYEISNYLPRVNNYTLDEPHFYIYNSKLYVFLPVSDETEFKSYLASNPLQVVYELATPTTIQLTPQKIQLLKGTNTLTASTGQISVTVNGVSGAIGSVQEQVNELGEDVALKQNATDNNLQTTDKTVVGAVNELKSGLTNVGNDVKLNTQDLTTPSRTKNLLPLTVEGIKTNNTSGTWSGNTYTENGITFTINTDDYRNVTSITANGQNSGSQSLLVIASHFSLFSGSYKLNGCPANGSSSSYEMYCNLGGGTAYDKGESATAVATNDFDSYCTIAIRANYNAQNLVFTPMIRLATETYPTFAPYIPSVESRIEAVESGLNDLIKLTNTPLDNSTLAPGGFKANACTLSIPTGYTLAGFYVVTTGSYTSYCTFYTSVGGVIQATNTHQTETAELTGVVVALFVKTAFLN